jgi:cyclophilin family peptidyl-prolyl cis-trans isomerase
MRTVIAFLLLSSLALAQSTPTTTSSSTTTTKTTSTPVSSAAEPKATIETTAGDLHCTLFKDKVPAAVSNFIGLAKGTKDWTDPNTGKVVHGKPLYDGTIFHRTIPNFMIQGGDPLGAGTGGPGYKIPDEFAPGLTFDQAGVLAYANSGPNTNGSQFFITEAPTPFLNPCMDPAGCTLQSGRHVHQGYGYTILGQCDPESVELVKKIARMPRGMNDRPENPVVIKHIAIEGAGPTKSTKAIKKPASTKTPLKKPGQSTPPKQQ